MILPYRRFPDRQGLFQLAAVLGCAGPRLFLRIASASS
jgi:hypothetical protein